MKKPIKYKLGKKTIFMYSKEMVEEIIAEKCAENEYRIWETYQKCKRCKLCKKHKIK